MRVVFAGAGHAALVALDAFARRPPADAEIVVVSAGSHSAYSGTVPGYLEGLYGTSDVFIELAPVVRRAGARLLVDRITGFVPEENRILTASTGPLPYDVCVLNTGSVTQPPAAIAADALFLPVKPVEPLLAALPDLLGRLRDGRVRSIVVAGGGVGGIEVMLALAARIERESLPRPALHLVEAGERIAAAFPDGFRLRLARHLDRVGVEVTLGREIVAVSAADVMFADGGRRAAGAVIWATGSAPPASLAPSRLALTADGFAATDRTFRSLSHPNVLAVGDIGTVVDDPRPRAGVYAVRSGKPLAKVLRALAGGREPPAARLQHQALALVSTGHRHAIGSRGRLTFEGDWVWRWKDHIDRRFVRRFR